MSTGPTDPRPSASGILRPGVLAALLLVPIVVGCGGDPPDDRARSSRSDAWRGVPVADSVLIPDVVLTDTQDRSFSLREEARGRITLLFFGYTNCPDVCPVQMSNLGAVLQELAPSVRRQIQVVFVTVDPRRDSAARLRSWLDRFGQGFVGLRADSARVAELQRRLRLSPAVRQDREVRGRYTVGHASQVLVFGPDARARLAYPAGTRQRDWAHDLPGLVRLARGDTTAAAAGGPGRAHRDRDS